jgi:4-hydroxy-tetrahydrodipicolinate reductase
MPIRIAVSGASGRMGRTLAGLIAEAPDLEAVGGIVREGRDADPRAVGYPRLTVPEASGTIVEAADVVVDFSAPEFLARVLEAQGPRLAGRAIVVGTTGLDEPVHRLLDAAARHSPVLTAANFSVGVNVLLALVEEAARLLPAERYDVEIVETHHRGKADAPSGTAIALGRAIAHARGTRLDAVRRDGRSGRTGERPTGEIGFHAVRGGGVVGEHVVQFLGRRERIELAHAATDRALFAEGALLAARWIAGRAPGRYTMRDVMEG